MERAPMTRQEKKGKKGKEGKGVYNQKAIRIREALTETRAQVKRSQKQTM
jgi:hypothetical protein